MKHAEVQEKVMFYDTDCGGVVSNIAYLRFVEKARSALFDALGMTASEMTSSLLFPAVTRTEINYLRPAKLGDGIIVQARVVRFEKVKIHCQFDLLSDRSTNDSEICFATAVQQVVLVQMPSGRPSRVPLEWIEA